MTCLARIRPIGLIAVLAGGLACLAPGRAGRAADALETEVAQLARDLKSVIDKDGGGPIVVDAFTGDPRSPGHQGPRIQKELTDALTKLGATIDRFAAKYAISGEYVEVRPAGDSPPHIKLTTDVKNLEQGERLTTRTTPRLIFGPETILNLRGESGHLPPTDDVRKLVEALDRAHATRPSVAGTVVRTVPESPFAVEVQVRSGVAFTPVPLAFDGARHPTQPLAEIGTDAVFAVRLINDGDREAAVDLRIDGINVFAFSETKTRYYLLAPRSSVVIPGWHKTDATSTEFKQVGFTDSAAARLGLKPSPEVGLITASFSAAWRDDAGRPPDEPPTTTRAAGFGRDVEFGTEHVDRSIGRPRDVIAVRYER